MRHHRSITTILALCACLLSAPPVHADTSASERVVLTGSVPDGCHLVDEVCTRGEAERVVEGFRIRRDCWEKRQVYACPATGPAGACAPLTTAPGCRRTGIECVGRDTDGICLRERSRYRCDTPLTGPGITRAGRVPAPPTHGVSAGLQCGSNIWCPREAGAEEGICDYGAEAATSGAFGEAASWMSLLSGLGREKDPEALTIFKGERRACSKLILGARNCCKVKGWLEGIVGCSAKAEKLARERTEKRTVHVGSYCSKKALTCVERTETYCAFRSEFSRVIQEQGRKQLGIGWGSAKAPDCRSLTLEEMQRIDFARLDLTEFYGDMLGVAQTRAQSVQDGRIKDRIRDYYNRRRGQAQ